MEVSSPDIERMKRCTKAQLELMVQEAILFEFNLDHSVDSSGSTLLHVGVMLDCYESVNHLLSVGASLSVRNTQGFTPLELAEDLGNQIMIQLISKWQAFRKAMKQKEQILEKRALIKNSSSGLYLSSTQVFGGQIVLTYEDYFDWTPSVQRFHRKELLEKLRVEEVDRRLKLEALRNRSNQLLLHLEKLGMKIGRKQHKLSSTYWREEREVRRLRKELVAVTDFIAQLRTLLADLSNVCYWSGIVELRVHKGIFLEVWRSYRLQIIGGKIIVYREDKQSSKVDDQLKRKVISVEDLRSLVIIKTVREEKVEKSLVLEYFHGSTAKVENAKVMPGSRTQSMHVRFSEDKKRGDSSSPKASVVDQLVHVLKMLNEKLEVKCEINGSRLVEYAAAPTSSHIPTKNHSINDVSERSPLRRATFDAAFTVFLEEHEMFSGEGRSSTSWQLGSISCLTSRSSYCRGRSISISISCSYSSGVTSVESYSTIASVFPSKRSLGLNLCPGSPSDDLKTRNRSRDDTDIPKKSVTSILVDCSRYSMPTMPATSSPAVTSVQDELDNLLEMKKLPEGNKQDVNYLFSLRQLLKQGIERREKIHLELEKSIASKESLWGPLSFIRKLRVMAEEPCKLQTDAIITHLDNYRRVLEGMVRGEQQRCGENHASNGSAEFEYTTWLLKWLAGEGCESNSSGGANYSSALANFRTSLSLTPRSSCYGGLIELCTPGHSSCDNLVKLEVDLVNEVDEDSIVSSANCEEIPPYRFMLGPPPSLLRDDFNLVLNSVEELWRCDQRVLEEAQQMAQLLLLREDLWRHYHELTEEDNCVNVCAWQEELVDVDI
eukprot:scaffold753_cov164-Ochromonas_danica.AAC.20